MWLAPEHFFIKLSFKKIESSKIDNKKLSVMNIYLNYLFLQNRGWNMGICSSIALFFLMRWWKLLNNYDIYNCLSFQSDILANTISNSCKRYFFNRSMRLSIALVILLLVCLASSMKSGIVVGYSLRDVTRLPSRSMGKLRQRRLPLIKIQQ
jgi:hypothetical protein